MRGTLRKTNRGVKVRIPFSVTVMGHRFAIAFLLLAMSAGSTLAAESQPSPGSTVHSTPVDELGEVVVSGEKPTRQVADLIPWLRRLIGQYSIGGQIDLGGQGNQQDRLAVRGIGLCVGFGVAPGVQCEVNVRWPEVRAADGQPVLGGVSALTPAMILYGLEPDEIGIRFLQVDNRGHAEGGVGFVTGNTASFTTPCTDVPDGCRRITRITAVPEGEVIDVQVDTELDYRLATRLRFQMHRTPEAPGGARR